MLTLGRLGGAAALQGGGWMLAFGIARIVILALVVYAMVRFAKRQNKQGAYSSAIQVLNERYARGEIDEAEYMQRKGVLTK